MRFSHAQRYIVALPPVQWHRGEVAVALDRLTKLIQAMIHMNAFPVVRIRRIISGALLLLTWCQVVLVELLPGGIEAVERVEDVEPSRLLVMCATKRDRKVIFTQSGIGDRLVAA
jgi:hypothetical protein